MKRCPTGADQQQARYTIGNSAVQCSGLGTCTPVTAACNCFTGYTGLACQQCSVGFRAIAGKCVLEYVGVGTCWSGRKCPQGLRFGSKSKRLKISIAVIVPTIAGSIGLAALVMGLWCCKRRRSQRAACKTNYGTDSDPAVGMLSAVRAKQSSRVQGTLSSVAMEQPARSQHGQDDGAPYTVIVFSKVTKLYLGYFYHVNISFNN